MNLDLSITTSEAHVNEGFEIYGRRKMKRLKRTSESLSSWKGETEEKPIVVPESPCGVSEKETGGGTTLLQSDTETESETESERIYFESTKSVFSKAKAILIKTEPTETTEATEATEVAEVKTEPMLTE